MRLVFPEYDTFPYPSHSQPFVNEYGLRLASNWDTIAPWSRFGAAETFATIIDVIKNEVDIAAALIGAIGARG